MDNPEEGTWNSKCGCSVSTGLGGEATFGRGNLSNNGYWEIPCAPCARQWEAEHPGEDAWPFSQEKLEKVFGKEAIRDCKHAHLQCLTCRNNFGICNTCHNLKKIDDLVPFATDVEGLCCSPCLSEIEKAQKLRIKDILGQVIEQSANYSQECMVKLESSHTKMRSIFLRVNEDFAEDFLAFLLERKRSKR